MVEHGWKLSETMKSTWPVSCHQGFTEWWVKQCMKGTCAMVKRRYERLQLRSAITTQNMWFTVCSDRGPCVAIPLFRLCLWLNLPVGRMTFQSFDARVRHWSSRSGLVFLGSCKMACRQVYMLIYCGMLIYKVCKKLIHNASWAWWWWWCWWWWWWCWFR